MPSARNIAPSVATQTTKDKSQTNAYVRPAEQQLSGPRPTKVEVVQRFNGEAYQHLYQKGFRAGRRYEDTRVEVELAEMNADLQGAHDRLDYILDESYRASLEHLRLNADLRDRLREIVFLRWLTVGLALSVCVTVYIAGRIG